jgi:hypothetical protein
MTIAKVLAVYKTSPIVLVVVSVESTVCDLSLTDLHAGAIGLVTGRGGASSRSIGCLPASLRQASHGTGDRHRPGPDACGWRPHRGSADDVAARRPMEKDPSRLSHDVVPHRPRLRA